MDREDIRIQLRQIRDLPTLPVVVTRVLEAANRPDTSAAELGAIVAQDVAVSAKILALANSAFYGFSRRIATVPQAVVVLGFDTVRSLALSVSVFNTMSDSDGGTSFDQCCHHLYVAIATEEAKQGNLDTEEKYKVAESLVVQHELLHGKYEAAEQKKVEIKIRLSR